MTESMNVLEEFEDLTVGEALEIERQRNARLGASALEEDHSPEIKVDDRAGARSYTLLVPLKVDGKWLGKVTLRLPSQDDIDDWGNGRIESTRALLCRLTGLHPAVVKALRWPDSEALYKMFRDIVPDFISSNEG